MIVIQLNKKQATLLASILKTKISILQTRFDRYEEKYFSGNDKYENLYLDAKQELEVAKWFINLVNNF